MEDDMKLTIRLASNGKKNKVKAKTEGFPQSWCPTDHARNVKEQRQEDENQKGNEQMEREERGGGREEGRGLGDTAEVSAYEEASEEQIRLPSTTGTEKLQEAHKKKKQQERERKKKKKRRSNRQRQENKEQQEENDTTSLTLQQSIFNLYKIQTELRQQDDNQAADSRREDSKSICFVNNSTGKHTFNKIFPRNDYW